MPMSAEAGLVRLLEECRQDLQRFLRARCGDADEAEDCLQDLWLKVANGHSRPIANGRAYLFRMANNLVSDRRRTRMRAMQRDRLWLEADGATGAVELRRDPSPAVDEELVQRQESELLARSIAALPPGARRALQLHRFDGHGQAEVARLMGISRSGVEKHLALAMRHLRTALADCGFFETAASGKQIRSGAGKLRLDGKS
ncbi:MAG: RNA polymerase sigma factor [Novosphingobium sp.]|nr:RNA polymerase sigma factor [Novosphingobium sp.]